MDGGEAARKVARGRGADVVWNERRADATAIDVKLASILSLLWATRFDGYKHARTDVAGDACFETRCGTGKLCRSPPFSPRSSATILSFLLLIRSCRPD